MQPSLPFRICPFLFLAVVTPVGAQEASPPPIVSPLIPAAAGQAEPEVSVDELVRRAMAENPQLTVARQTEEAARQRVSATRVLRNPMLELVPRIAGSREAADGEVILSQPIDVFGQQRAQARVAAAELRRAGAESTLAERSLVVQVKNAAADLFSAQEAESLGTIQLEIAQLFRDAAARRAQLGDVPPVQVQRAELEVLRVQNELSNAQAERQARRAALNQLVGQAPNTPLRVTLALMPEMTDLLNVRPGNFGLGTATGSVPSNVRTGAGVTPSVPHVSDAVANSAPPPGVTPPEVILGDDMSPSSAPLGSSSQVGSNLTGLREQVLPGALTNRPDIVGARATLEARRAQVNVVRRQRLPNVELQARRGSFFGQSGSYALRAVVTLPLFDFGSLKGERRALEAEVRAQEASLALLRTQVAVQVEQALIRLQQQRATAERYRTGIVPQTLDLLRKTQVGYTLGASTYLEVLEAQRTFRQVQTEYLQALVATRSSEAALEGALGAVPPSYLQGNPANPTGPSGLPGIAAPGTVPQATVQPTAPAPLSSPSNLANGLRTTPGSQAGRTGVSQP